MLAQGSGEETDATALGRHFEVQAVHERANMSTCVCGVCFWMWSQVCMHAGVSLCRVGVRGGVRLGHGSVRTFLRQCPRPTSAQAPAQRLPDPTPLPPARG